MSNTRHAEEGNERDERFASDPALNRGLRAGDVIRKCQAFDDQAQIELALFLQYLSNLPGGLDTVAANLLAEFPERLGTPTMHRLGLKRETFRAEDVRALRNETPFFSTTEFVLRGEERLTREDDDLATEEFWNTQASDFTRMRPDFARSEERLQASLQRRRRERAEEAARQPSSYPAMRFVELCRECFLNVLPGLLRRYCIDPSFSLDAVVVNASECTVPVFHDLPGALLEYVERWEKRTLAPLVITKLGAKVIEALDYAEEQKTLALVEGFARTGKTFIAREWAAARPGRRRFVSLSEASSEKEFFREISQAISAAASHTLKANELRERLNDILRPGFITLVLDEAQWLWPTRNIREALPRRIEWVRCSLSNYGVAVAMIATHQFTRAQQVIEKNTHWSSEQLTGRIGFCAKLPDHLDRDDIAAVARYHLPTAEPRTVDFLVDYVVASKKHLAAIDHGVRAARHAAKKAGRTNITHRDVLFGFQDTVSPSDRNLAAMAQTAAPAPVQKGRNKIIAEPVQPHGKPISAPDLPARGNGATLATANTQDRLDSRSDSSDLSSLKI